MILLAVRNEIPRKDVANCHLDLTEFGGRAGSYHLAKRMGMKVCHSKYCMYKPENRLEATKQI